MSRFGTRRTGLAIGALVGLVGCGGPTVAPGPAIDLAAVAPEPETFELEDLEHLRWILEPSQIPIYEALDPPQRAELLRVRWAELDPTPTTIENERRDEHYRRLAFVRAHFAREDPPGWDQRGELLLRYGSPDVRTQSLAEVLPGRGLVPPKEVWVYAWLRQAYELEDRRLQDDFQDAFRDKETTRQDLRVDTSHLTDVSTLPGGVKHEALSREKTLDEWEIDSEEMSSPRAGRGRFAPVDAEQAHRREVLSHLVERGREALDSRTQAFRHDYGGEQLPFAFDVVNFASRKPGQTRVEVHIAYRGEDLGYVPEEDAWEAVLNAEAVVKTMEYRELDRMAKKFTHRQTRIDSLAGHLVLDQVALDVPPGEYRLALSVVDSVTSKVGMFEAPIAVRRIPRKQLSLSDIQIALNVGPTPGENAPFTKGDLQIVPFPLSTFPRDRDVFLYFEIYGLAAAPKGSRLYTVDFLVKPRTVKTGSWFGSSRGRLIPGVRTSYDGITTQETAQEYLELATDTFGEDVYDLEITVTDRVNDRRAFGRVTFSIQEP